MVPCRSGEKVALYDMNEPGQKEHEGLGEAHTVARIKRPTEKRRREAGAPDEGARDGK
ncbi:hypothetical protein ACSS6W_011037 [Trichoderma asperelloides]